jgi:tRNA(Ile)-lysidine synthase
MNVHSLSNRFLFSPLPRRLRYLAPVEFQSETLLQFPPSERYLVGVSGGRDSVALLHWLVNAGYKRLLVCHLDHQLRGRAASADAAFVERLAAKYRLQFVCGRANIRSLAAGTKQSIETAARAARLELFAQVARHRRCHTIFVGHHADDLVETFLMNLFRGTGRLGRAGIAPVSIQQIGDTELTIVRPLLNVWRDEIDAYIAANGLRFREDATNATVDALRNRMRHVIIPTIAKQFGRDVREAIWRAAAIAADEDNFLDSVVPRDLVSAPAIALKPVRALPVALQRRALLRWLRAQNVRDIDFNLIEQVRHLAQSTGAPAKVNLPGARHVRRRAGELFIQ